MKFLQNHHNRHHVCYSWGCFWWFSYSELHTNVSHQNWLIFVLEGLICKVLALLQVMPLWHQAPSHCLNQGWPSSTTPYGITRSQWVNTLRQKQNGRRFADDILKCIFVNDDMWISINISLKFVPKSQINNIPALVQILAWCRPGEKPSSEPIMVRLLTHICVTRPQCVKKNCSNKMKITIN